MADRRRYTGTKSLQVGWTLFVLVAVALLVVSGLVSTPVSVGGGSVAWVVGLILLGFQERSHWNQTVAVSSFDRGPSGHTADLQQIIAGKSVTVTTDVTGVLTPEHTQIRATVEDVDASFSVRITDGELADTGGLTTGVDALDERFVISGAEGNVARILTEDVASALLAVDAPGTYTIMPDRVVFEVPFTRLTTDELEAAGEAVARIALRLEEIGQA